METSGSANEKSKAKSKSEKEKTGNEKKTKTKSKKSKKNEHNEEKELIDLNQNLEDYFITTADKYALRVQQLELQESASKPTEIVPMEYETPLKRIANQETEPEFKLKLEPSSILRFVYFAPSHASVVLRLKNTSSKRQAFKIKATDNKIYRATPSVGFMEPGEVVHIRVLYVAKTIIPPDCYHHVAVFHATARPNAKIYAEAFEKGPRGVAHLYCYHKCKGVRFTELELQDIELYRAIYCPLKDESKKDESKKDENKKDENQNDDT